MVVVVLTTGVIVNIKILVSRQPAAFVLVEVYVPLVEYDSPFTDQK